MVERIQNIGSSPFTFTIMHIQIQDFMIALLLLFTNTEEKLSFVYTAYGKSYMMKDGNKLVD